MPTPRRTALVTGPTAGIGAAFARQLAERGHDIVLVARDQARLNALADELRSRYGVEAEMLVADLADREQLARVEGRVADPDRPVHVLVNNAGFGHKRPFLENSVEDEQQMLDVLVTAVLRLTHAALGAMVARGDGQIVIVSSIAGYLPRGTYSAAKAYVTSLSRWADATYSDRGVRVMALLPGFTKTEFHARMDVSRRSASSHIQLGADRVVREALADLDAGRPVSIPSRRYKALAALSRVVPLRVLTRFQRVGRR